ncbi:unnamed protein product [Amoebophrya sp. A120]|nr:unnamed protein product [Amoebophrya sp. A120]|eukprot:GSA120T00000769001.1
MREAAVLKGLGRVNAEVRNFAHNAPQGSALKTFFRGRPSGGMLSAFHVFSLSSGLKRVTESLLDENTDYLCTGVFNPSSLIEKIDTTTTAWHVNPTLFWRESAFDLHYGTNPIDAFSMVKPDGRSQLTQCFDEFQTWVTATRAHRLNVEWTFDCQNAVNFCSSVGLKRLENSISPGSNLGRNSEADSKEAELADELADARKMESIQRGSLVKISGLVSQAQHNGCVGVVTTEFDADRGRIGVRVLEKDELCDAANHDAGLYSSAAIEAGKSSTSESSSSKIKTRLLLRPVNLAPFLNSSDQADKDCVPASRFDVITSSNLADHIGLLTVVLMTRPLLRDYGVLLTSTFVHRSQGMSQPVIGSGTYREFFDDMLLKIDPCHWESIFGFRAVGFEPDVLAPPLDKTNSELDVPTITRGVQPEEMQSDRQDAHVTWIACPRANIRHAVAAEGGTRGAALTDKIFGCESDTLLHPVRASVTVLLSGRFALDKTALEAALRKNPHCTEVKTLFGLLSNPSSLSSLSRAEDKSEEDEVVLCKVALTTTEMKQHFGEDNITPTFGVQLGTSKIFGTWADTDDSQVPLSNIFFFASRSDVKKAGGNCKLFSIAQQNLLFFSLFGQSGFSELRSVSRTVEIIGAPSERDVATLRKHYGLEPTLAGLTPNNSCTASTTPGLFTFTIAEETTKSLHLRYCAQCPQVFREALVVKVAALSSTRLQVKVRIHPTMNGAAGETVEAAEINHDVQFACPVSADGWWSAKDGTFIVKKVPHSFFSSARRIFTANMFVPEDGRVFCASMLRCVGGMLFSTTERAQREDFEQQRTRSAITSPRKKKPVLLRMKDVCMTLLQFSDEKVHAIFDHAGCVCIVFHHGLVMNRQSGLPFVDVSVCMLRQSWATVAVTAVRPELMHGCPQHTLSEEEYAFFCNWCRYSIASCTPSMAAEHPELRSLVSCGKKAAWVRQRCVRVLLGPLFPSMNSIDSSRDHLDMDAPHRELPQEQDDSFAKFASKLIGNSKKKPADIKAAAPSGSSVADFKAKGNHFYQKSYFTDAADQFHAGEECFSKIANPTFAEVFDGVACSANAASAYLRGNAYIGKSEVKPSTTTLGTTTGSGTKPPPRMNITMFDMKAHTAATTAIDTADKYLKLWAANSPATSPAQKDVLRLEALKIKALFRRGQATLGMKEAVTDLTLANELGHGEDAKVRDMLRLAEEMLEVKK